jgi:hypothetical protein
MDRSLMLEKDPEINKPETSLFKLSQPRYKLMLANASNNPKVL